MRKIIVSMDFSFFFRVWVSENSGLRPTICRKRHGAPGGAMIRRYWSDTYHITSVRARITSA